MPQWVVYVLVGVVVSVVWTLLDARRKKGDSRPASLRKPVVPLERAPAAFTLSAGLEAQPIFLEFAQKLHTEAGLDLDGVPDRAAMLERLAVEVQNRVGLEALSKVPDEAAEELEKALLAVQAGDSVAMAAFLTKHVPNLVEITEATLRQFRLEYLESAAKLKEVADRHARGG